MNEMSFQYDEEHKQYISECERFVIYQMGNCWVLYDYEKDASRFCDTFDGAKTQALVADTLYL